MIETLAPPESPVDPGLSARISDPSTSIVSAFDVEAIGRRGSVRRRIMETLFEYDQTGETGLTYEEVMSLAEIGFQKCPWKRLQELHRAGWLDVRGTRVSETTKKPQSIYHVSAAARTSWKSVQ